MRAKTVTQHVPRKREALELPPVMYEYGETEHAAWRSVSSSYIRVPVFSRRPKYPDGDNSENFGAKQHKVGAGPLGEWPPATVPCSWQGESRRAPLRTSNEDDEAASDGDGIP